MPDRKRPSSKPKRPPSPRTPSARKPAARERSAGVIVHRADPDTHARLYLLLDYGRYWDYPKGHLEPGEDDRTAALRELAEETGIRTPDLDPHYSREITYYFRSPKGLVRKEVVFFLARVDHADVVLSDEHVGAAYLTYAQAMDRLHFPTAKELLRTAEEHLNTHPDSHPRPAT